MRCVPLSKFNFGHFLAKSSYPLLLDRRISRLDSTCMWRPHPDQYNIGQNIHISSYPTCSSCFLFCGKFCLQGDIKHFTHNMKEDAYQTNPRLCPNQLGSTIWILLRHWALSRVECSLSFNPIISFFTTVSNVNFSLLFPLVSSLPIIISLLLITTSIRHVETT